jgi:hypothetical protein
MIILPHPRPNPAFHHKVPSATHLCQKSVSGFKIQISEMAKKTLSKSPGAVSHLLTIIVTILAVLTSWKFLCYATNSSSPVIVVISGSMEPTYHRGDILFLWNNTEAIEVGEVATCWFEGNPLPMVHRVIQKFNPEKYVQYLGWSSCKAAKF